VAGVSKLKSSDASLGGVNVHCLSSKKILLTQSWENKEVLLGKLKK
jgi:hypothetical protein